MIIAIYKSTHLFFNSRFLGASGMKKYDDFFRPVRMEKYTGRRSNAHRCAFRRSQVCVSLVTGVHFGVCGSAILSGPVAVLHQAYKEKTANLSCHARLAWFSFYTINRKQNIDNYKNYTL